MSNFLKRFFVVISIIFVFTHCGEAQIKTVTIKIDISKTYQSIDNFGASDAWSCQFVGNWPDAKKEKIADLLFSKDTLADGTPKGIALSLWRFNIGAGSAEQGDQSHIRDDWRRAESMLDSSGNYDWNKQRGQIWFLKAAKDRGVEQLLGFCNSPPVQYTVNRKAFADSGHTNIASNQYKSFATYLTNVVNGLKKNYGISLNYISPVNEPQWAWSDGGQEGCPYTNNEIAGLVRKIDSVFVASNVASKIVIGEAGSIDYLYANNKSHKGNQASDFFKQSSTDYIGNLASVRKTISAHSYFTTSPMTRSVAMRKTLADSISDIPGLSYWQSEYCILGDNAGEINGPGRDLGMNAALYMASVIHTDLTVANASAWQWWLGVSPGDYKDGLVYIDRNKTDGNYYTSKMLWVLGNYSRFIRPGAVRVDASLVSNVPALKPLLVSAFRNGKDFTAVVINPNREPAQLNFDMNGTEINLTHSYTTSNAGDLKAALLHHSQRNVTIAGHSVMTITGKIQ